MKLGYAVRELLMAVDDLLRYFVLVDEAFDFSHCRPMDHLVRYDR